MTDRRRNALIGLFILGGLTALGTLIVKFGEAPQAFIRSGYVVRAKFASVTGVREGTEVTLGGVPVGRVLEVDLWNREDPTEGVAAKMEIRWQFTIPVGSQAVVIPPLMGQPTINIIAPRAPSASLPRDGTAQISGNVVSLLSDAIPPEFMAALEKTVGQIGELAAALTPAANALEEILKKRPVSAVEGPGGTEGLTPNLYTAVERLHNVLKHLETVLGDPQNQDNLKTTLANFKAASEEAKLAAAGLKQFAESARVATTQASEVLTKLDATVTTTHQHIDVLGKKLVADADKLSKLLDYGVSAGHDLAEGEGTMGLLLRDPKFYQELLFTTQRLGLAADELVVLIKQWQKSGVLGAK